MTKFWMIYGVGQGTPVHHHSSLESAKFEAARLARKHPGVAFWVLEALEYCVKNEVTWTKAESKAYNADEMPF